MDVYFKLGELAIQQIIGIFLLDWLPYLWLNLLGCALVMGIAIVLQFVLFSDSHDKEEAMINRV